MQSAIQIKSDKNNFTCIQCADKERFKTTKTAFGMHSLFNIAVTL